MVHVMCPNCGVDHWDMIEADDTEYECWECGAEFPVEQLVRLESAPAPFLRC